MIVEKRRVLTTFYVELTGDEAHHLIRAFEILEHCGSINSDPLLASFIWDFKCKLRNAGGEQVPAHCSCNHGALWHGRDGVCHHDNCTCGHVGYKNYIGDKANK